ncbi:MAG TPA: ice-binding family protein [Patescibacteria group bacterium]|nr:ice-binding family protein [Patescibacteria group bacterium]
MPVRKVYAATTPSLGQAATFGILSSSYTNGVVGTTINGDLGYTTGPFVSPTVSGSTHVADSTYNQAGTDQGSALTALNAQTCDFNFGSPTDLSLLSQPLTPGVYCIAAAASIGSGGITLSGSGTYVFRIDGALTTVANSVVTLSGGASACDVFWTPTQATTLGANSTFKGTDIDDSGITIGSTIGWEGRALSFGGTVSTTTDTITVPSCSATPAPTVAPSQSTSGSSLSFAGPSFCTSSGVTTIPAITLAKRLSPTSIFVSWGPDAGLNNFIVQYGLQNGNWQFSTKVSGFSTTINDLPPNQSIWIEVAATDNCLVGSYSSPVRIGGTVFTNSPRFPNTGNPGLPDTGFNPVQQKIIWKMPLAAGGLILLSLTLIVLFLKKRAI